VNDKEVLREKRSFGKKNNVQDVKNKQTHERNMTLRTASSLRAGAYPSERKKIP